MGNKETQLRTIKISQAYESENNPRGVKFEDDSFKELIASIKEKGVLVPVIARPRKNGKLEFEIVAGNRRFRAAQKAGLEEIPARVEDMDDESAREVQIIENLQRKDIHPLDEGEVYRKLVEHAGKSIKDVAVRLGKNEKYVRQRLFLTNLIGPARKSYRNGEFSDSHAVLLARLTDEQQTKTLNWLKEVSGWEERSITTEELKRRIEHEYDKPLENQPWLHDRKAAEAVGSCTICPPNRSTLFGDRKEGECVDLKCHKVKMEKYLAYQKELHPGIILISGHYTPDDKTVIGRGNYETLNTKKKRQCESATLGLVVEGSGIGKVLNICADMKCKTHGRDLTPYQQSPDEKAKRKKEAERAKKKAVENAMKFQETIKKVKFPLSEKQLDALLDFAFYRCGVSVQQPAMKLLEAEPVKKEEEIYGFDGKKKTVMRINYQATLRAWAEKSGSTGKLQVIFALMMPHPSNWSTEEFNKALKKL